MQHARTLIIGYGNPLRGDDGVGPAVAEVVAAWKIPDLRARAVAQLVPELVDDLKHAERVLFVDASQEYLAAPFTLSVVEPRASRGVLGHFSDPGHLLALARDLEGHFPASWMLAIQVHSFAYGEEITEVARANMTAALEAVRGWLRCAE